jgi:hypothetical protein
MALVYQPYELLLFFMKIPNFVLSLVLALKIKHRSGYILNHLYYMAFLCWSVFISTDAVLFMIAANGGFLYTLANILRDVSVVMICLIPLFFIQAGHVINEGEEIALSDKRNRLLGTYVVNFLLAIAMLLADSIVVYDASVTPPYPLIDPGNLPPVGAFVVNFDTITPAGIFGSLMILVFVAWYMYGVVSMFFVQRRQAGMKRSRSRFILAGTIMIPAGILYFIAIGFIQVDDAMKLMLVMLGHVMWMASPTLVYLGMRLRVPDNPVNDS